ncbi:cyclic nucleotide-binding domain-containing protein [Roseovarius salis]|uniref:Crp/Fnr family transcriptional regulator n=1 Tax=Roseovarius salis TaxID=3376063 RepID=UPI0037C6BAC7
MLRTENLETARGSLLLQGLPEHVIEKLLTDASTRDCARGETVFLQGESAQVIHIVLEGWVKLYRVASNGNEAVVNVFTRGQSFGEAVAFRLKPYPVSAEAVTDCKLLQISARTFISILHHQPELAVSVLAATFQHLHALVGQVEQIKAQTGAQRVADFLIHLCDGESGSCVVRLPYDKALIAGRLGMKPESLSRAFSKLKPVGVEVSRHHATVRDIEALQEFAEQDPADAWNKTP